MRLTNPSNWNAAAAAEGTVYTYAALLQKGSTKNTYTRHTEDALYKMEIRHALFSGQPSVGNFNSAEMSLDVKILGNATPPARMGEIIPYVSATLSNGTTVPEIPLGKFYIDTREKTGVNGVTRFYCMDAAMLLETPYVSAYTTAQTDYTVLQDIISQYHDYITNFVLPTSWGNYYSVPFTAGTYTVREVIRYIAAAHMCNVAIINHALFFIPITGMEGSYAGSTTIGKQYRMLETSDSHTYTGVEVILDDEQSYTAGTTDGEIFTVETPWGTQEMANRCWQMISGWTYYPYEAGVAYIPACYYLGDAVTITGQDNTSFTSVIASFETHCTKTFTASIGAEYNAEIDHEYQYESAAKKEWSRQLANTKTTFEVQTQAIIGRVEQVEGSTVDCNLLAYPYADTTTTRNGITFTDNGDGSITLSGTSGSSAGVVFYLENKQQLPAGAYVLSGRVPNSTVYAYSYDREDASSGTYLGSDTGDGLPFTLDVSRWVRIYLYIGPSQTFNNITFYPMLASGSSIRNWRTPVASVNSQLKINAGSIESKVSLTDFTGNNIASLINQSATTIQIEAQKINLQGYVTVTGLQTAGSTVINGGNISTGNIKIGGSTGNTDGGIFIYDANDNLLVRLSKTGLYLGANQYISCSKLYGGTVTLGGASNANGSLIVNDSSGTLQNRLDKDGLTFYKAGTAAARINNVNVFDASSYGFEMELLHGTGICNYMTVTKKAGIELYNYTSSQSGIQYKNIGYFNPSTGLFLSNGSGNNLWCLFDGGVQIQRTNGNHVYVQEHQLDLKYSSGHITLDSTGLRFYDASGNLKKSYPSS